MLITPPTCQVFHHSLSVTRQQPSTRLNTLHTEHSLPTRFARDIEHNVNHGDSWQQMVVSCQAFQVNISKDSAGTDITVSSTVLASYPLIIQSSWSVFAAWLAAQLVWGCVVFVIVVITLWTWPFHATPPIVTTWPWSVTPFLPKIKHTNIYLTILSRNNWGSICRAQQFQCVYFITVNALPTQIIWRQNTEYANILNVPYHILLNTHSQFSPRLSKRLTTDSAQV